MIKDLQPKLAYGVIGAIILAAFQLGLFVTKGDLYQNFAPRTEIESRLNVIDAKIDKLTEIILRSDK